MGALIVLILAVWPTGLWFFGGIDTDTMQGIYLAELAVLLLMTTNAIGAVINDMKG